MKAVLYGRVSSDDQMQQGTIAMQQGHVAAWARGKEISLVREYLDEDVSGTVMFPERPAGGRLLADAPALQAAGVGTILLYDWSRLARDPCALWDAIHRLERVFRFRIRSVTQQADTSTPETLLMLCVTTGVSSFERAIIRQRVMDANRLLAGEGAWLGGVPPYGYRVEGSGRGNRRLVIDEEEHLPTATGSPVSPAAVVRTVYAWAESGMSLEAICDRLHEWGVPPRASTRVDGRSLVHQAPRWTTARLHALLANPVYRGERHYGRHPQPTAGEPTGLVISAAPALVSPELWHAAAAARLRNRTTARRNAQRPYLLRGLLKCARCGQSLIGRFVPAGQARQRPDADGYLYYACAGRKRDGRPAGEACHLPSLNASAEAELWETVRGVLRQPEEALSRLRELRAGEAAGGRVVARLERLRRDLADREAQRERVRAGWRKGLLSEEEFLAERAVITGEERALEAEIAALTPQARDAEREAARYRDARLLLAEIGQRLSADPGFEQQRAVLEALVEHVTVDFEGSGRSRRPLLALRFRFEG